MGLFISQIADHSSRGIWSTLHYRFPLFHSLLDASRRLAVINVFQASGGSAGPPDAPANQRKPRLICQEVRIRQKTASIVP